MKSTADILRDARALIDTPDKWTKGEEARDAAGDPVLASDGSATCFCAVGAVRRSTNARMTRPMEVLRRAIYGKERVPVPYFNDDPATTHADVLAAFDRAIALAETQA